MAEKHENEKQGLSLNAGQLDAETAQVIEKVNHLISGFGQSIFELVKENSNINLSEADLTNSENTEMNQAIQNIINDYIQNINSLNSELGGKIANSITGTISQKENN
ncbi:hypothetical protein OZL92_01695 [Bacillus sonorensis]|uniref:Uncharacterized protein n=2 Tax=Bacillus sonorensis TaxID=119858 RepID=M5P536_9BACI|nr:MULTISPECIES: hypothetical protein [Bacillus]TWK78995.1 hypothetical protein CHCC20335_1933 [Bacillus paralicheniformis]ASB88091.1 hypothetical protein S101395_01582 [Bacillus sonorensis]EME75146.1 hypothetical protein BSONL12_09172 [Bacillus sonorensis L12]MBG9915967.1 hypothetical protein [Bacillus sonorensis]MCF7617491.1 hypothetical protein [Bacillus sonorensis]